MKFATRALATIALAAAPTAVATADVIYTRPHVESTQYFSYALSAQPFPDQMRVMFGAGPTSKALADLLSTSLFDDSVFSAQNVGQTWTSTPASDPDFAAIAAILTNGVEDKYYVGLQSHNGPGGVDPRMTATSTSEKSLFFPFGATDLAGYTLSSISVTLESFQVNDNHAPNPSNPGDTGRQYVVDYTLTFNGQAVPEPAALVGLCALAMPAMLGRRRRK